MGKSTIKLPEGKFWDSNLFWHLEKVPKLSQLDLFFHSGNPQPINQNPVAYYMVITINHAYNLGVLLGIHRF